ncbi:hypothetical protein [Methylobacterium marchantiae]|uniref:Uncharacterized protein n=1 Tax=Methylobacterium marchantiae TaxID=600331 RepID=A0ABW3X3D3_9HYPH|nr:hypothetical protein AIGOOFII_4201 [Methylobacterium marchantiae]
MRMTSTVILLLAFMGAALAQQVAEPPIQSPQDAACREQARAQVFSAPNPSNLGLYDLGSQIYHACMASYHGTGPNPDRKERRF